MDARVSSLVERRPVAHSPLYLLTSARTGAPAAEVPHSFVSRHIYLVPSGLTLSCETSSSVRILVPHRGGLVARVTSVCGRLDRRRSGGEATVHAAETASWHVLDRRRGLSRGLGESRALICDEHGKRLASMVTRLAARRSSARV